MRFAPLFVGMLTAWLAFNYAIPSLFRITAFCSLVKDLKREEHLYETAFIHEGNMSVDLPRILCFLNTYPKTFQTKAIHVHHTWARRCTETVFTTTAKHSVLKILKLALPTAENRSHLWTKLRMALRKVRYTMSGFDYYYRADDDTYAVMENLFKVAKMRSPSEAYMTGYRLTHEPMSNHFSGGGGYLISRPALSVIVDRALDRHPQCPSYDGWKDDLYIAACATAVGVRLYDTVNVNGLSLFYWGNIRTFVKDALHHSKVSGSKTLCRRNGSDAPADEHISFHYMGPSMQYIMEFLVYYAWPLGLRNYDYCDNKEQQK